MATQRQIENLDPCLVPILCIALLETENPRELEGKQQKRDGQEKIFDKPYTVWL